MMKLDMTKLDQLTEDLRKLEAPKVTKGGNASGEGAVPMFQSKGYLEKLGTKRSQWYKRFFVLRDSFLMSYNLQKSDYTVEPNKCIHLVKSKFEVVHMADRPFVFSITTQEKDRFLFACESEAELNAWRKDIEIARIISHKNMVKLAVENRCLAEAKGVAGVIQDFSSSALSIFSNPDYIKKTPVTGGAEGWLRTPGYCVATKGKKSLKKCYFMLRDSHLLMFHGGDVLKKPRGAMYLVGTRTTSEEDDGGIEGAFKFICKSDQCADFVELYATSESQRTRWVNALVVGSRVTYGDFKLLLKEHEVLSSYEPGSDEGIAAPDDEEDGQPIVELNIEDTGIQGEELEPGTVQPYDAEGNPLLRTPEGMLVTAEGDQVQVTTARYNARGQQLDAFNRPLPKGAVPMFTQEGAPIGVGPDGKHYLPDGTEIAEEDPHFDSEGNQLPPEIVQAANAVARDVDIAIKVRAAMKGEGAGVEEVDVLGRTFRPSKDDKADTVTNADGVQVPVMTARRVVNADGELVQKEVQKEAMSGKLVIKIDEEGDEKDLGEVEIDENTNMQDVRAMIREEVEADVPDFVFIRNYVAMTAAEELDTMAMACLPEVIIRGVELKKIENPKKFTKKVQELVAKDTEAARAQEEFDDIMARVRAGNFLRKREQD